MEEEEEEEEKGILQSLLTPLPYPSPLLLRHLVLLFTCGRRPAGLLVNLVVVVGGNNFYTWAFERAHVWSIKN